MKRLKKRYKFFFKRKLLLHWDEYGSYEFGIYLYDLKEQLIGYLSLYKQRMQNAYINYSHLNSKYRNRGLGKLIYIEAINHAFFYGYKKIISKGEHRNGKSNKIWLSLYHDFPDSLTFKCSGSNGGYIDWIVIKPLVKKKRK